MRDVYRRLSALGFELWMDKINLLPGQRWRQEIPHALRASDFVLVFLSQHSVAKRGYVQREFKLALDTLEEIPEGVIHTIPIRLSDCEVPEQFHDLQWCDLFEEDGFERLVQAIRAGVSERQQHLAPQLTNSIGMEFVLIPAGTFLMGSHDGRSNEQPVHQVTISQPFYLNWLRVLQIVSTYWNILRKLISTLELTRCKRGDCPRSVCAQNAATTPFPVRLSSMECHAFF